MAFIGESSDFWVAHPICHIISYAEEACWSHYASVMSLPGRTRSKAKTKRSLSLKSAYLISLFMGDITSPSFQVCRGPMAVTTKHAISIIVINYVPSPRRPLSPATYTYWRWTIIWQHKEKWTLGSKTNRFFIKH